MKYCGHRQEQAPEAALIGLVDIVTSCRSAYRRLLYELNSISRLTEGRMPTLGEAHKLLCI